MRWKMTAGIDSLEYVYGIAPVDPIQDPNSHMWGTYPNDSQSSLECFLEKLKLAVAEVLLSPEAEIEYFGVMYSDSAAIIDAVRNNFRRGRN